MDLKNKIILAPLAGINDLPFRMLCRRYGADICFTGMISSEAINRGIDVALKELDSNDSDRPLGVQLFGNNSASFIKAASIVYNKSFKPEIIDINCGCPDSNIIKQGAGASLLNKPEIIYDSIKNIKKILGLAFVSVKIRSGINMHSWEKTKELVKGLESSGADAIIVHPRTAKQGYSGTSDWSIIRKIKQIVSIPVIGNGDIRSVLDAKRMFAETGCDSIMIGRAAMKNPFIFQDIKDFFETGTYPIHTKEERIRLIYEYISICRNYDVAFMTLRNHILMFLYDFSGSSEIRASIARLQSLDEILENLGKSKSL